MGDPWGSTSNLWATHGIRGPAVQGRWRPMVDLWATYRPVRQTREWLKGNPWTSAIKIVGDLWGSRRQPMGRHYNAESNPRVSDARSMSDI